VCRETGVEFVRTNVMRKLPSSCGVVTVRTRFREVRYHATKWSGDLIGEGYATTHRTRFMGFEAVLIECIVAPA
jgi:hypothetical protein